jgi:hypothetical protein
LIISDDLVVIINFPDLSSDCARKTDLKKVPACIKETKIRSRDSGVSDNVARIVDALERRSSRARVINSRVSSAGLEKTLRLRGVIRSFVLTHDLPGIIDSASVRAAPARVNKGGVHASGQKEGDAWAIHPVKAHNIAKAIDSYRSSAGDSGSRVVNGGEHAAAQQEVMRAFKLMAGISEICSCQRSDLSR